MKITVAFGCSVTPPTPGSEPHADARRIAAIAQGLIGVRQFSGRQVDRVFELVSAEPTTRSRVGQKFSIYARRWLFIPLQSHGVPSEKYFRHEFLSASQSVISLGEMMGLLLALFTVVVGLFVWSCEPGH